MKRIPIIFVCVMFSLCVLMAIRNRPRPESELTVPAEAFSNYVVRDGKFVHTTGFHALTLGGKAENFFPTNTLIETLTVDTLNVTNVDMVEQALIEELGLEQGVAIYRRVTELARAHRETNRGVFPGATTNRVLVEFEEEP